MQENGSSIPRFFQLSLLRNDFPFIHGLRTIAVFSIVQFHVTGFIIREHLGFPRGVYDGDWFRNLSLNTWFALDIFFFLSGFVIGTILLAEYSRQNSLTWQGVGRFWLKRSFRIIPLYYFLLVTFYFLNRSLDGALVQARDSHTLHIKEFLFLTNYPVSFKDYMMWWSWSLSLEEHFYLVVPIVVILLFQLPSHKSRIIALVATWFVGGLIRLGIYVKEMKLNGNVDVFRSLYTPTHCRIDILVAGLLLSYLCFFFREDIRSFLVRNRKLRYVFYGVPVLCFGIILSPGLNQHPLGIHVIGKSPSNLDAFLSVLYFGTITSIAYFLLLIALMFLSTRLIEVLSHGSFRYLGTLGYGVFLVHIPIALQVSRFTRPLHLRYPGNEPAIWLLNLIVTLAGSMALAYGLHLIVEKPALKLRDLLFDRT
jgi:peptidoglycan/LPS O-acetylase OafA/YrhL